MLVNMPDRQPSDLADHVSADQKLEYVAELTGQLAGLAAGFPTLVAFLRAAHQDALRLKTDLGNPRV